jgi:hypothetical protein
MIKLYTNYTSTFVPFLTTHGGLTTRLKSIYKHALLVSQQILFTSKLKIRFRINPIVLQVKHVGLIKSRVRLGFCLNP